MIQIRNLQMQYSNGLHALKDINLDIPKGEFVAVIGPSGSGKSTLLRCINRLVHPTSGSISIDGSDICVQKGRALRRHRAKIGMIFQHFNLIDRHSVLKNVFYGGAFRTSWVRLLFGFPIQQIEAIKACLKLVGLEEKIYVRTDELSGGQKQRVSIARALYQNSSYLLADEPVSALDPVTSRNVMEHLRYINQLRGITVICNLHSLDLVKSYATRAVALKDGSVIYDGSPKGIDNEWFNTIYEA